jgi:hypothetical protein
MKQIVGERKRQIDSIHRVKMMGERQRRHRERQRRKDPKGRIYEERETGEERLRRRG